MFLAISKIFFTSLGYKSIGRIFHYYINYDDFGFIKHGLWGTVIKNLGLTGFIENKYVEYIAIYLTISIFFIISFWYFFNKNTPDKLNNYDICLALIVMFSPATFLHLGYSPGNFDAILLILFVLNILILKKQVIFASLLCSFSILIHEVYLLAFFPFLFWIVLEKKDLNKALNFCVMPILIALCILLWGRIEISKEIYLLKIKNISPYLLNRDGFFELNSTLDQNITIGFNSLFNFSNWAFFYLVVTYIILVLIFLNQYTDWVKIKYKPLSLLVCFMPLTLSLFGNDIFRWISFFIFNLFIFMIINRKNNENVSFRKNSLLLVISILLFFFLGPLGDVFNGRPFPVIQTILSAQR